MHTVHFHIPYSGLANGKKKNLPGPSAIQTHVRIEELAQSWYIVYRRCLHDYAEAYRATNESAFGVR